MYLKWYKFRLIIPVIISFIFLIYGIYESWSAGIVTQQQEALLVHTTVMIGRAKDILRFTNESELNMQRYIIAGFNTTYLVHYKISRSKAAVGIVELQKLMQKCPNQQNSILTLKSLIQQRLQELDNIYFISLDKGRSSAILMLKYYDGKLITDEIKGMIETIEERENQLLLKRQKVYIQAAHQQSLFSTLSIVGGFILAFIIILIIEHQRQLIQRHQYALINFNLGLEHAVSVRTSDLFAISIELDQQRSIAELGRARVELLLRELNHRLGNNLALVSAFLGLEALQTQNTEIHDMVERARNRIYAISTAQRRLQFDDDIVSADARQALNDVLHDLSNVMIHDTSVVVETDISEIFLSPRDITTLAIMLSEVCTNAIKYAFIGKTNNHLLVSLEKHVSGILLTVKDNGTGFDTDKITRINRNLGQAIVIRLAQQYGGDAVWKSTDGKGTIVTIALPKMAIQRNDSML